MRKWNAPKLAILKSIFHSKKDPALLPTGVKSRITLKQPKTIKALLHWTAVACKCTQSQRFEPLVKILSSGFKLDSHFWSV